MVHYVVERAFLLVVFPAVSVNIHINVMVWVLEVWWARGYERRVAPSVQRRWIRFACGKWTRTCLIFVTAYTVRPGAVRLPKNEDVQGLGHACSFMGASAVVVALLFACS